MVEGGGGDLERPPLWYNAGKDLKDLAQQVFLPRLADSVSSECHHRFQWPTVLATCQWYTG